MTCWAASARDQAESSGPAQRRAGDGLAVLGPEQQQLVGLVELEHDALGADPQVGIDLPRWRGERPVDGAGVPVQGDQLGRAAEAIDATLDQPEPMERAGG